MTGEKPGVKLGLVLRRSHILALLAAGLLACAAAPSAAVAAKSSSAEAGLLQAMNAARAAHGLRPLRLDSGLDRAAGAHTAAMLHANTFAHGDFAGRMAALHQSGSFGENLAWGTGSAGSAQWVVRMWLASPEHRANLLRPGFHRLGLGLARGTFLGHGGATVVTADFGS
jgi:uncharacterized protein YkwD